MSSGAVGAIGSFATGSYTVTRTVRRGYTLGRLNAPSTSSFSITACVQPMSGRELQDMPEGMRSDNMISVWTTTAIQAIDGTNEPDKIAVGSDSFEVVKVETWNAFGETHYRAFCSKVSPIG